MQREAEQAPDAKKRSFAWWLVKTGVVTKKQMERVLPLVEEAKPTQQIPGYKILKELGKGAMARVFLARQMSLDRLVAIKVLPKRYTNNPEWVERFYAEGRAAAKLNHPNIVGALDVGHAGDYHYFVMEYVEGRSAFDDIAGPNKYTEKEALDMIIQIARALEHAHAAGFIHRDVKPKNIMITNDNVAKLADMGLARAISDKEAAEAEQGKAFGTPYYISPEQIRGQRDIDFRADIYGLGATFYHVVTGQVPFDGPNPSAVMHAHLKDELEPPDHINENLSAGIGEIIEVCMAKKPRDRYKTTTDLLHDLESVSRGEPPLQARRKFDLASLSTLEGEPEEIESESGKSSNTQQQVQKVPLVSQPLLWIAIAGWLVGVTMTIVAIIK